MSTKTIISKHGYGLIVQFQRYLCRRIKQYILNWNVKTNLKYRISTFYLLSEFPHVNIFPLFQSSQKSVK